MENKQLKAQMGKLKAKYGDVGVGKSSIIECMEMIDKKINKINGKQNR